MTIERMVEMVRVLISLEVQKGSNYFAEEVEDILKLWGELEGSFLYFNESLRLNDQPVLMFGTGESNRAYDSELIGIRLYKNPILWEDLLPEAKEELEIHLMTRIREDVSNISSMIQVKQDELDELLKIEAFAKAL